MTSFAHWDMSPKQSLTLDRDIQDFISKIIDLGKIPEGGVIATLDVTSLYTNIPNEEGILAMAEYLRKDPSKGPVASYILDLLKLVLHYVLWGNSNGYCISPKLCKPIYGQI